MRIAWVALLILTVSGGCSRPAPPPAPAAAAADPNYCQIDPITAALPGLPTHLAASDALTAFTQETSNGLDTVYQIDAMETSRPTLLTSAAIGKAMGKPGARGNIQDLAADGSTIYFYYAGSAHRAFVSCLGRMGPSGKIEILADQQRLGDFCGMGDAISIYRGQLAISDGQIWLWLHSEDGSYFIQIDPKSSDPSALLRKPFDKPVSDLAPPSLTRESYALAPGPGGGLLILDYWSGILWYMSPVGFMKPMHNFTGLPSNVSAPAMDEQGRIGAFFAGSDMFVPREDSQVPEEIPFAEYPALLLFGDKKILPFGRSALLSPAQFPQGQMQISAMISSADGSAWIGYDAAAGEIFRLHLLTR